MQAENQLTSKSPEPQGVFAAAPQPKQELSRLYRHETSSQNGASGQDPLLDESTDKTRRSIERARATAHSVINRTMNRLRKRRRH